MLVVFNDTEKRYYKEYRTSATELTAEGVERILAQHISSGVAAIGDMVEKGVWNSTKCWTSASGRYLVEMRVPEE